MALVRVYCGISSAVDASQVGAPGRLTVAVVDDSGRLLEYCEINDDPAGYAVVTALLAERFSGTTIVMIAVDSDEHLVVSLLAAAGRPIAYADDETAEDFAERFADDDSLEEVQAAAAERRAVGLARALQAGAVSAAVTPTAREFAGLKPILAAHAALAVGKHAAAVALREVLRELYPAALRAYPDPATPVALAMLDALPEPGLLGAAAGRGRDAAVTVAARLVADGVCDNNTALEAVTSLRVAITETPRRNGVAKQLTAAISDAVRASVAAVRSADAAVTILIHAMNERVAPAATPAAATTPRRRVQPAPITTPAAPRPVAPPPVAPIPVSPAPVAPVARPVPVPQPVAVAVAHAVPVPQPVPVAAGRPAWAQSTPPPAPPGFEPTPVTGTPQVYAPRSAPPIPAQRTPVQQVPVQQVAAPAEPLAPFVPTLTNAVINHERAARGLGGRPQEPEAAAPPGSRANWPLVGDLEEESISAAPISAAPTSTVPTSGAPRSSRITPPWQADDLVLPPSLRLVESASEPSVSAVPTRLVDDTALTSRIPKARRTERNSSDDNADDTDLLIFSSVSSAWFTGDDGGGESTWNSSMDLGWRAAEEASLRPSNGGDTNAGLPRRVPSANLVPGSPLTPERPLRIVRDAGEIAAHTSNYFRGYRRGNQEAGGFSVGGRPGRESAAGWDFSRDHEMRDERGEYGQRAVNYR